MARVVRIELTSTVLETVVLPLHHTPMLKGAKAPVDVKTLIYIVPIQYIHERR